MSKNEYQSGISPRPLWAPAARPLRGTRFAFGPGLGSMARANVGSVWKEVPVTVTALIIDDSPFARRVIRHHLAKFGCKVVGEAESAAQGMRMFDELRPDLVTLDIMMPGVDGLDALQGFRAMQQKSPNLAVIVVSSVPFDRTRDTFLKEGALAYVVKPFNQFSFEPVRQKLIRFFRPHAA